LLSSAVKLYAAIAADWFLLLLLLLLLQVLAPPAPWPRLLRPPLSLSLTAVASFSC
jgi:hypothetical protein